MWSWWADLRFALLATLAVCFQPSKLCLSCGDSYAREHWDQMPQKDEKPINIHISQSRAGL
jgi:hypothetical protein